MDKKKVIIILLVLNLLVMLYYGNALGKKIGNYQAQTSADMNVMQNNIMSLENRIINGVGNELRAQADRIAEVDYTLLDVDPVLKKAQLELKVTLKEVSPLAEISISYSAQDDDQSQAVALVEQSGLIYGTKLEMSLDNNYRFDVWEKSVATGQKKMNVSEQRLPLYDDFYTNRVSMNGSGTASSQDRLEMDFTFSINDLGVAGTEMEQVLVQVWKDNVQYDEVDVTQQLEQRTANYAQIENKYKVAIAAGQIDQSVSLEQFAIDNDYKPDPSNLDDNLQYSYTHSIIFAEDYPELNLDAESAKQLSSRLIIKFKDGYIYTSN